MYIKIPEDRLIIYYELHAETEGSVAGATVLTTRKEFDLNRPNGHYAVYFYNDQTEVCTSGDYTDDFEESVKRYNARVRSMTSEDKTVFSTDWHSGFHTIGNLVQSLPVWNACKAGMFPEHEPAEEDLFFRAIGTALLAHPNQTVADGVEVMSGALPFFSGNPLDKSDNKLVPNLIYTRIDERDESVDFGYTSSSMVGMAFWANSEMKLTEEQKSSSYPLWIRVINPEVLLE